jgi:hypothetical protein
MIPTSDDRLVESIAELRRIIPEMRFGQLVANLATAAGCTEIGGIWDVEDDELLRAARRLIERNCGRISASVG